MATALQSRIRLLTRLLLVDPGYVTAHMLERMDDAAHDALEQDDTAPTKQPLVALSRLPPCRRCRQPKPFRAHHCSFCNKCVLKMGAYFLQRVMWLPRHDPHCDRSH